MTQSYRHHEESRAHEEARARFVNAEEREEARCALEAARALVIGVDIGASARGRLGDIIDEAIERELDARGAAPPGIGATSDMDAALSDQLFRARRVGASGLVLSIGPLRAATSPLGALEPEDGATLRFWAAATSDRPVCLLLDATDLTTGAYTEPVALGSVIARALHETRAADVVLEPTPTDAIAMPLPTPTPDVPFASVEPEESDARIEPTESAIPDPSPLSATATATATLTATSILTVTPPEPSLPTRAARRAAPVPPAVDTPAPPPVDHHPWLSALHAARGPQPLAAFERLFANAYMPLLSAVTAGLDDPRAYQAIDEFRRTFARAYTEACPTFAITGKRPKMVLDAFDVASRIARLHGARSTQLLLVDAMRFDLGGRVLDTVRANLGPRASLTDEVVLWSALPTTTPRQLDGLARGIDALLSNEPLSDREGDALRGRTADVIRRVKLGSRDVYKLDSCEARLREDARPAAFDTIAQAAADAITRHAMSLRPRTLLFVFGDHGFTVDRDGNARQGGASPEEALVGAFALLVGDTH